MQHFYNQQVYSIISFLLADQTTIAKISGDIGTNFDSFGSSILALEKLVVYKNGIATRKNLQV